MFANVTNLVRRLNAQIDLAKGDDEDFCYVTVGDAKRIVKILTGGEQPLTAVDRYEAIQKMNRMRALLNDTVRYLEKKM